MEFPLFREFWCEKCTRDEDADDDYEYPPPGQFRCVCDEFGQCGDGVGGACACMRRLGSVVSSGEFIAVGFKRYKSIPRNIFEECYSLRRLRLRARSEADTGPIDDTLEYTCDWIDGMVLWVRPNTLQVVDIHANVLAAFDDPRRTTKHCLRVYLTPERDLLIHDRESSCVLVIKTKTPLWSDEMEAE